MHPPCSRRRFARRAVAIALALLAVASPAVGQEPDKATVDAWVKAAPSTGGSEA